jgi:hypothetical protein
MYFVVGGTLRDVNDNFDVILQAINHFLPWTVAATTKSIPTRGAIFLSPNLNLAPLY